MPLLIPYLKAHAMQQRPLHPLLKKTFGQKLTALRNARNYTQQQVGDRIHVSRSLISKWEIDEQSPQVRYVQALAKLFDVSLSYWD